MPDVISFLTAILGLFSAIVAYKSVKNEKMKKSGEIKTVDNFKDLKIAVNAFGTILLVLIFYFGFIIMMMSFPSIMEKVLNMNNEKENEKKSDQIVDYSQIKTLNEISFYSANSISNSTKKDEQLDIVLNNSLEDKEYDLVLKILKSYSSVKLEVFDDPAFLTGYDFEHSEIEERYYGIGNLNGILIVLVFFTEKKDRIRLISARQADKDLREEYYDYFKKINS